MTRAQSFKALACQSMLDRIALLTFTPQASLDHTPSSSPALVDDRLDIESILRSSGVVRQQNA